MHGGGVGRSDDSKLSEAKISSNSDIVDAVIEAVAASTFARHWETILSLERITSARISWPS